MTDQIQLNTSQLAEALAISQRRIQQLAKDGIIPKARRGRWPLHAIRAYVEYLHADARRRPRDYQDERARLTRAQADMAEATLAQRRGELLNRDDVDAAVAASFTHVRARLLSIPSKCAAETVAASEPREAEAIIRAAVYEALTELSATTPDDLLHIELQESFLNA